MVPEFLFFIDKDYNVQFSQQNLAWLKHRQYNIRVS